MRTISSPSAGPKLQRCPASALPRCSRGSERQAWIIFFYGLDCVEVKYPRINSSDLITQVTINLDLMLSTPAAWKLQWVTSGNFFFQLSCATFSALSSIICPWVWTILLAVLWLVEIQPSHPLWQAENWVIAISARMSWHTLTVGCQNKRKSRLSSLKLPIFMLFNRVYLNHGLMKK